MKPQSKISRRKLMTYSAVSFGGLILPPVNWLDQDIDWKRFHQENNQTLPEYYPNINPEVVSEVVGKSHFDLERVKALVDKRPELSRSVWEWRYGDFESAIGAASHVGRRDIVDYLISKGARPTIFTFAMLGQYESIKAIVEANPGIQTSKGPHGISLLEHAYAGERMKGKMSPDQVLQLEKTIDFLENLGDAGPNDYIEVSPDEQEKYLGDYKYGSSDTEGFTIQLNMRKMMALGPIGGFGGALYKIGENLFEYNGAPSVNVQFEIENNKVLSLTVTDPDHTITAKKVS